MADYIFELDGTNAKLFVSENNIAIQGKKTVTNIMAFGTGNPTIPISSICSINYGVGPKGGSIEFSVLGDVRQSTYNRNIVIFRKSDVTKAEEIKKYIEKRMDELKSHQTTESIEPADEIRKYKQLLDDGIINQEDFEIKKKQLLGI